MLQIVREEREPDRLGFGGDQLRKRNWSTPRPLWAAFAIAFVALPMAMSHDAGAQIDSESDLHRGSTTMNLGGEPLALTGPGTHLAVSDGALTGTILNRRFDAKVQDGRVVGSGPDGAIDVALNATGDALRVNGTWNGHPIDLTFTEREISGKAMQRETTVGRGVDSCRYDIARSRRGVATGLVDCLRSEEPTRVDVRPAQEVAFNRTDAALLLVAFLTAPK